MRSQLRQVLSLQPPERKRRQLTRHNQLLLEQYKQPVRLQLRQVHNLQPQVLKQQQQTFHNQLQLEQRKP